MLAEGSVRLLREEDGGRGKKAKGEREEERGRYEEE